MKFVSLIVVNLFEGTFSRVSTLFIMWCQMTQCYHNIEIYNNDKNNNNDNNDNNDNTDNYFISLGQYWHKRHSNIWSSIYKG